MSMNDTPASERVHIGLFGIRNAGKSSLMNALTGQSLSIVSEEKGTTTDPVKKAMELLPLGPVVFIDTPGLDDEGTLGELRKEKSLNVFRKTDIVLLVLDGSTTPDVTSSDVISPDDMTLNDIELTFLKQVREKALPLVIVVNKCEKLDKNAREAWRQRVPDILKEQLLFVSAKTGEGIWELKERLAAQKPETSEKRLIGDLLAEGDLAVLVVPIDSAAPKGRLILPQQQVIRDILETGAIPIVTRDTELPLALARLAVRPKIVITDSQAFKRVAAETPEDIYLTSFSILMARYKGDLEWQTEGAKVLDKIKDGDRILIAEGCTHHRQCEDIGTVKLPRWIEGCTKKKPEFVFTNGGQFPEDLSEYALIVHCGGCTLNEKEMNYRIERAKAQNVPITNYGVLIAYIHGILERSLEFFQKNKEGMNENEFCIYQ